MKKFGGIKSKNYAWKGKNASYSAFHVWLADNYGKPRFCDFCKSIDKKVYEWALKHGKEHDHKRFNYFRLCASCHRCYDFTEEKRRKMTKARHKRRMLSLMVATDEEFLSLLKERNLRLTDIQRLLKYKANSTVLDRLRKMIEKGLVTKNLDKTYTTVS